MLKNLKFGKAGLFTLVIAVVAAGFYIYLNSQAASETITAEGCQKLKQESRWRQEGLDCIGPNGVILGITH